MTHRSEPGRKRHLASAAKRRGRKRLLAVVTGAGLVAVGIGVPAYAATHDPHAHPAHPVHPVHPAWAANTGKHHIAPRATRSAGPAPVATGAVAPTATTLASSTPVAAPATSSPGATTPAPTTTATQPVSPAITPSPVVTTPAPRSTTPAATSTVPRPDHVVVVVEENHSYDELASLPYATSLMASGATLTESYGITHPSQPNYLALWSGSTQGVTDNSCPQNLGTRASLGSQLISAGVSVGGYLDAMPSAGYSGCASGSYVRRHNPLADFDATNDARHELPFTEFPTDFTKLPTVSLVVPDLNHDMHDGSVQTGDTWLGDHLGAYAAWAKTHNSLLIVTADEDDEKAGNHILTVLTGEHVKSGVRSSQPVTHYSVLHTLEDAYGLSHLGQPAASITGIWQ